jgi:heme-degrading monooxygenase HmoA
MIKHVILWKLKEMSAEETAAVIADMKEHLESLAGKIPGLLDIKVYADKLPSSNMDVMLDSSFESAEALKGYAVHPAHVAVADTYVRPFTASRACLDFTL